MKVYAKVLPTTLGRAIYRINKAIRDFAPPDVEFVSDHTNADIQILDVIGPGSLEFLYKNNYVLFVECFCGYEHMPIWESFFNNAKLVVSYLDLPAWTRFTGYNFFRLPLGADSSLFYYTNSPKYFELLSTGYVAEYECIDAAAKAVERMGSTMIHVGGNLKFGNFCRHYENIPDSVLNDLYNRSRYTIGMRKIEGFELPIIEGLLAGSRGICLDYPCYSYWYKDLVEYVKDGDVNYIADQIYTILTGKYRPVTKQEIDYVREMFNWNKIMKVFWDKVYESV